MSAETLQNETMRSYSFLEGIYEDDYFPNELVDKCKAILVELCGNIESSKPADLQGLYTLTKAATDKISALEDEFEASDSELEASAREVISIDLLEIAKNYGYKADQEALTNW